MRLPPPVRAPSEQEALNAALRLDFPTFLRKVFQELCPGAALIWGHYLDAIVHQLERTASGEVQRLIVTMPPRYLKSITISVAWVVWQLANDPTRKFMCISYSDELAAKLARDRRQIMESPWFRRAFPDFVLKRCTDMELETDRGGKAWAGSIGGSITGFGADVIILDDPIKADDAMSEKRLRKVRNRVTQTIFSRFDDKRVGIFILVMQRLHEDDLAGYFLRRGGWEHLNLPAIAEEEAVIHLRGDREWRRDPGTALHPERDPLEVLQRIKADVPDYVFEAQYQQSPIPAGGTLVKRDWLKHGMAPERCPGDEIIQSWDTASKVGALTDYSVCVTGLLRGKKLYVLDVYRGKLNFPDLLRMVELLANLWDPDVLLIEDAASGQQLIPMIDECSCPSAPIPTPCRPEGDKLTRMAACCPFLEVGGLILPEEAHFLGNFKRELLSFPYGRNDDQVDALSQLLTYVRGRPRIVAAIPYGPVGSSPWRDDPDEIDIYDDHIGC